MGVATLWAACVTCTWSRALGSVVDKRCFAGCSRCVWRQEQSTRCYKLAILILIVWLVLLTLGWLWLLYTWAPQTPEEVRRINQRRAFDARALSDGPDTPGMPPTHNHRLVNVLPTLAR